ncbi:hypothetical protein [Rugosimonospora africana]|nr:hypothetical protein [Rugosimonospora africana]
MFALLENPPDAADEYLEAAAKDTERLIRSVMHVRWRLITGIMIQIPSTNHEVIHSANVALGTWEGMRAGPGCYPVLGLKSVCPGGGFVGRMHR